MPSSLSIIWSKSISDYGIFKELPAKDDYDAGYAIDTMPNTNYADLSYMQIGLCNEYLEKWKEAEDAYTALVEKYTDEYDRPIIPSSENVVQAVNFAKDRKDKIMGYRLSLEIQKSGSSIKRKQIKAIGQ